MSPPIQHIIDAHIEDLKESTQLFIRRPTYEIIRMQNRVMFVLQIEYVSERNSFRSTGTNTDSAKLKVPQRRKFNTEL